MIIPRIPTSRLALTLLAAVLASGCGTVKGWLGRDNGSKAAEPTALSEFSPSVGVSPLWKAAAGDGEGRLGVRQRPAIADGRVYAAALGGGVRAFDLQSGALLWHGAVDVPLSGGPGVGEGLVVAGSLEGDVIAFDAASGGEKWRAKVANEVLAAPAVGGGLVLVRSNDGRVTALDAATGQRRWFWNHELPNLTVRGNGPVALGPGVAFVGNDDGSISALSMSDGAQAWQQAVGQAEGRTDLDRMADVDGAPVLDGTTLYATSYKRQTMALDAPSGRPLWSRENGGVGGLGLAADRLVVADSLGTVWAIDRAGGGALWQQPLLARRALSAPAVHGDYAVVGDFEGYLHWLKLDNGELAARIRAGGAAIRAQPVVADGVLVVQNIDGGLSAYRLAQ